MAEWSEHVRRAAKVMKIVRLRHMPGMDATAIRLNSEPTIEELIHATAWLAAFTATEDARNNNLEAIADDLDIGRHN